MAIDPTTKQPDPNLPDLSQARELSNNKALRQLPSELSRRILSIFSLILLYIALGREGSGRVAKVRPSLATTEPCMVSKIALRSYGGDTAGHVRGHHAGPSSR